MNKTGRHAVVVGASMGGLLAARALSDHYARVTIVERDALPDVNEPRKGVPQGRHAHGLLARGSRALEELFPDFRADLIAEGGSYVDIAEQALWSNFGGYLRHAPSDILGYLISRPTLEQLVRRRVSQLPNVDILQRTEAVELAASAEGQRVTGLMIRAASQGTRPELLDADLVVDAGGRGGSGAGWLERLGYPTALEERVEVNIAYTTRQYRRRPEHIPGVEAIVNAASAPDWRVGVILAQDGDRWTVTLGGYFGDRAPDDEAGFVEFARGLAKPDIYNVIRDAEPISPASTYAFKASLRRRYERLPRFPQGFLVFGDALCSFNPIYGQGMSVAAMEALALKRRLAAGSADLAGRFFADARKIIDIPWQMAVGADLAHPRVEGRRTAQVRFVNWYIAHLFKAGETDSVLAHRFLEVANLLRAPESLLSPSVAWRVLRGRWSAPRTERLLAKPSTI